MAENNDLIDKVVKVGSKLLMRLGVHAIAIFFSLCVATSKYLLQDLNSDYTDYTDNPRYVFFILNYLGFILLFPRGFNFIRLFIALACALFWSGVGMWQLAIPFAAMSYIIGSAISKRSLPRWWVCIYFVSIAIEIYALRADDSIPLPYAVFFIAITLYGGYITRVSAIVTKQKTVIKSPVEKKSDGQFKNKPLVTKSMSTKSVTQISAEERIIARHMNLMQALLRRSRQLPKELLKPVLNIAEQTKQILHCMETDPRDFSSGDKFLSRYLQATQNIVVNYLKIAPTLKKHERFTEILKQNKALLEKLNAAFIEQHARLLQNDADDMVVELNVLDKLLKIEGFK